MCGLGHAAARHSVLTFGAAAEPHTRAFDGAGDTGEGPHGWSATAFRPTSTPAFAAAMRAIWIDAHVWDDERRETQVDSDRVIVAGGLAEVPAIVADITG